MNRMLNSRIDYFIQQIIKFYYSSASSITLTPLPLAALQKLLEHLLLPLYILFAAAVSEHIVVDVAVV